MPTGKKLNRTLRAFIEKQTVFFVATADKTGRVNVSPKGMDTLRIEDDNRIVWLNLSGSGNETAAHVRATGRMTLMFCAFEG
ncbi:MAG: pyridoxamine 5'-phosphate oxidase family protein, partial [Anderseniella sp.]